MNISPEILEKIHRYLLEEMSLAEREAFEQEMADDADLSAAVLEEQRLLQLIQGHRVISLREEVQAAALRHQSRFQVVRWAVPAALAAAAVALFFLLNPATLPSLYEAPPHDLVLETQLGPAQDRVSDIYKQMLEDLDHGRPEKALKEIQLAQNSGSPSHALIEQACAEARRNPLDTTCTDWGKLLFLEGHCYRQMDSLALAVQSFTEAQTIIPRDWKLYSYNAWYLIEAVYAMNDTALAKAQLKVFLDEQKDDLDVNLLEKTEALGRRLE